MQKKTTRKRAVTEVTHIVCDKCGREMDIEMQDDLEFQESVHIEFVGGYSSVFGDGAHCKLDLCQHCLNEVVGEYIRIVN